MDAWLDRSAKGLPPAELRRLLEAALGALWTATKTTLGEVTLTAIAERVLYTAAERFPLFWSLRVEPKLGFEFNGKEAASPAHEPEVREGIRFVLVEFLTVLGNLTAELLTPELHAKLSTVTLPRGVRSGAEADEEAPAIKGTASARAGQS